MSSRVEGQDVIYDTEARVRTALALGDASGAFAAVRDCDPRYTGHGSPADSIAEAARAEVGWLHDFVARLPNQDADPPLIRHIAARGWLALAEGRFPDAAEMLAKADRHHRDEGFLLDAWHTDRALVEALARGGDEKGARELLVESVREMDAAGARLAARLMRETAASLGLDVPPEPVVAAPIAEVGRTGERMVSVLFADVRGYTVLAGQSAPADVADRIASLQRWASHEVERQRGIVDKFAGDAVMATFNVSGESVDHAVHALQAAIAIIDKAALAGLPVGAGIAAGPAVVGRLAESANVSVLGDVTNLAARLQASAGAGEIVISQEAYRRVRGWLDEQAHPAEPVELELKGFPARVPAFKVSARAGIKA